MAMWPTYELSHKGRQRFEYAPGRLTPLHSVGKRNPLGAHGSNETNRLPRGFIARGEAAPFWRGSRRSWWSAYYGTGTP